MNEYKLTVFTSFFLNLQLFNHTMLNINTKTVAFHTLGCKLNFAETSTIARQLIGAGYQKVEFDEPAQLYVINTCSVTDNADKECKFHVKRAISSGFRVLCSIKA